MQANFNMCIKMQKDTSNKEIYQRTTETQEQVESERVLLNRIYFDSN